MISPSRSRLAVPIGIAFLVALTAGTRPAAASKCPQILLVMDRTGSMTENLASGDQKWAVLTKAVKSFTSTYSKSIRFGFEYFNGNGCQSPELTGMCAPGCLLFDPKDDAATDVATAIDALTPLGSTPTWETMTPLKDYAPLKDPTYSNFILLITDGLPNCGEEMDMNVVGGYSGKKSIAAIKAVADGGVPVFVMGVGTKGAPGLPALNTDILDQMAEAGGEPQKAPAAHKFYAADSPAEVSAALAAIAGRAIGGTVTGCIAGSGGSGDGSAGDGAGTGGASGGGGQGGQSGAGGQGGTTGDAGGTGGGKSGCGCRLGAREPAPVAGLAGLVAAVMGGMFRSRRWRP